MILSTAEILGIVTLPSIEAEMWLKVLLVLSQRPLVKIT